MSLYVLPSRNLVENVFLCFVGERKDRVGIFAKVSFSSHRNSSLFYDFHGFHPPKFFALSEVKIFTQFFFPLFRRFFVETEQLIPITSIRSTNPGKVGRLDGRRGIFEGAALVIRSWELIGLVVGRLMGVPARNQLTGQLAVGSVEVESRLPCTALRLG